MLRIFLKNKGIYKQRRNQAFEASDFQPFFSSYKNQSIWSLNRLQPLNLVKTYSPILKTSTTLLNEMRYY